MVSSLKHWFLTLLPLLEVSYPLNYEFLRTGRYNWYQSLGLRDLGIHEWWVLELKPECSCFLTK